MSGWDIQGLRDIERIASALERLGLAVAKQIKECSDSIDFHAGQLERGCDAIAAALKEIAEAIRSSR